MKVYLVFEHSTMAYEEAEYLLGVFANKADADVEYAELVAKNDWLYTAYSIEEWAVL